MAAQRLGNPEMYVTLVLFLAQILTLFFALLSSFTAMFGRKDHELLSSLPIPRRHIYLSSVLTVYASGCLTSALVLIPSIVIYGIGQGFTAQMLIMMIPAVFLAPILPVCLAYGVTLALMRLLMRFPFKEQAATVLGILLTVGYMIFNMSFSSKLGEWLSTLDLSGLLADRTGWFGYLLAYIPGIRLTGLTLVGSWSECLLAFALMTVISAALLVLMYFLGSRSFFAVRSGLSNHAGTKAGRVRYASSHPFMAYVKREFVTLVRCPVYVLNGLIGIIMGPVLLLMIFLNNREAGSDLLAMMPGNSTALTLISLAIVYGILQFAVATVATVPSSSYSREGLARWVTQVAPVSVKTDYMGRAIASLILFWLGDLLTWGMGWIVFRFPLFEGLVFLVAALFSAVPSVLFSLMIDCVRPMLSWEKEAQAVKQNINTFFAILLAWVVGILCCVPTVLALTGMISLRFCLMLTLIVPILLAAISVVMILILLNRRIVKL